MRNKRMNVGLFIADIKNDFDNAVCRGVMQGAKENDVNLIIFPGHYLKPRYSDIEHNKTAYQYNTLFSYANGKSLDVLMILMGTVGTMLSSREKKIFLDMFQDIPVVLIADERKGYSSVCFDNKSGLRDGIENIIAAGRKKIGFVSGPTTSADAMERLDVYKEVLSAHQYPIDEDLIVYGNFSEYSEEVVKDLLDRNPDIDAIVFANDQMAIGGYHVMKEKGLRIGEDVFAMGFDDSPTATMLVPNLTTVRADAVEMGRVSVSTAIQCFQTKKNQRNYVRTNLVQRSSTRNEEENISEYFEEQNLGQYLKYDIGKAAEIIFYGFVHDYSNDKEHTYFKDLCIDFIKDFLTQVFYHGKDSASFDRVIYLINKIMTSTMGENLDLKYIFQFLQVLKDVGEQYQPSKTKLVSDLIFAYMVQVTVNVSSKKVRDNKKLDELFLFSYSIAKDMLVYEEGNDMSYLTVMDKLLQLHFQSAYLYAFKVPFINKNVKVWHDWQVPANMQLKAYYTDYGKFNLVPEEKQEVLAEYIYNNEFIPQEKRFTFVVNNIFMNEEQLGMFLCEIEHNQLYMLSPLASQLASSFKMIHMLRVQNGIQKQLECSLQKIKESNEILEAISKTDELTGVYNRRGFFEAVSDKVHDPKFKNKKAILIFADLDNLKIINDKMGHEEGDFAIRSTADILKDSMRASDVVARIGGDEFAALAIMDNSIKGEIIKDRIKELTENFNATSSKDYYIGISVGYAEFSCDEAVEIEKYLDEADVNLYQDKKKKRVNIMKNA